MAHEAPLDFDPHHEHARHYCHPDCDCCGRVSRTARLATGYPARCRSLWVVRELRLVGVSAAGHYFYGFISRQGAKARRGFVFLIAFSNFAPLRESTL
jgi:hypothetical protein